ncbi:aspartyl-phosphate phosphatase Spo0E family protein [Anaerosporomusa subterranea]|uniref:Spo0E family sporulation regulatory protein-aspartic acid phosphatase n=1 Tax=Anaerosporomusa subterranea TaxID=1794912 RepID=UPI0009ED82BA
MNWKLKQVARLIIKIEEIRQKLHCVSSCHGYSDPEVVSLSQELDELLNQHRRVCSIK